MHFVLWDTRHGGAYKDFAGGFGVGTFRGKTRRGKYIERFYQKDFRCPPLAYAYLAAGLKQRGHTVEYALEDMPAGDVYLLMPALMTVGRERDAVRAIAAKHPQAKILVLGTAASTLPEAFAGLPCRVGTGEPEQLLEHLDLALEGTDPTVPLGTVASLDALPIPDWTPFPHKKFKVAYDFSQYPTAYIQSSRGCTLSCSYCPYIILENKVRTRSPELVGEELRHGMKTCGFRSFKFRDPLFAAKRPHALAVAEQIAKLPRKIQFSVESRIELLSPDLLRHLRDLGLTSVTIGLETPSRDTLLHYKRAPIKEDKQRQFVETCRELRIRVIAGFMIGFPEDTIASMRAVFKYAKEVNPFAANFNVVTPYPGTGFINEIRDQIDTFDWSRYDVYTPNLKYQHVTPEQIRDLHEKFFRQYYFRWDYLFGNWRQLFPRLQPWLEPIVSRFERKPEPSAPQTLSTLPIVDTPEKRAA